MSYRHLPAPFHPIADAVVAFLRDDRGITGFVEEEPIHAELDRPTLHAKARDHHYVCVEFSETTPYPPSLDRFVLDCMRGCHPVKVFVALPTGSKDPQYNRDLRRAHDCGVGVIEVDGTHCRVIHEPLSLSLAGVRPIPRGDFPQKYRLALSQAEATFRQRDPVKGCANIYDELEALSRRIAKKSRARGFWAATRTGSPVPTINIDTGPWARVMAVLMDQLDPRTPPQIPQAVLASVLGITRHRNDADHKPKSTSVLIRRDREQRTRFETATDVLRSLIDASKSLNV